MEDLDQPLRNFVHRDPLARHAGTIRGLALGQGAFYFLTGLWPLFHLRSFLLVTGPKTDLWLVQTFGAVLAVLGAGIGSVGGRRGFSSDWIWLSLFVAVVLGACDMVFVVRGVISPIYLGDAAVEFALAIAWLAVLRR